MSDTTDNQAQGQEAPTPLGQLLGMGSRPIAADTSSGHDDAASGQSDTVTGDNAAGGVGADPAPAKPQAATPAEKDEGTHVPLSALLSERSKRQELEARLKEMQEKAPVAPDPIPNPAIDPEGYHARIERDRLNDRMNISEMLARQRHADLDEKVAVFREEAAKNPALVGQLFAQIDPYGWAYSQGQKLMALREIGDDPAQFRAKIVQETEASLRERIRAEVLAEHGIDPGEGSDVRASVPVSVATARSASVRQADTFRGPTPLGQLLRMGSRAK